MEVFLSLLLNSRWVSHIGWLWLLKSFPLLGNCNLLLDLKRSNCHLQIVGFFFLNRAVGVRSRLQSARRVRLQFCSGLSALGKESRVQTVRVVVGFTSQSLLRFHVFRRKRLNFCRVLNHSSVGFELADVYFLESSLVEENLKFVKRTLEMACLSLLLNFVGNLVENLEVLAWNLWLWASFIDFVK